MIPSGAWQRANSPAPNHVGASLLAMTVCQTTSMSLPHGYREQARSHRGFLVNAEPVNTPKKLWERACSR